MRSPADLFAVNGARLSDGVMAALRRELDATSANVGTVERSVLGFQSRDLTAHFWQRMKAYSTATMRTRLGGLPSNLKTGPPTWRHANSALRHFAAWPQCTGANCLINETEAHVTFLSGAERFCPMTEATWFFLGVRGLAFWSAVVAVSEIKTARERKRSRQ